MAPGSTRGHVLFGRQDGIPRLKGPGGLDDTQRVKMSGSVVRERLRKAWRSDDSGFTLIEAVVALGVATVMFTALAYAAIGAIRATQVARANQQAIDLANDQLENLRQLPWGELVGLTTDGAAPATTETVASNNVTYTVATFVTTPPTSTGEREARVVVTWNGYGTSQERVASSAITYKTQGLPNPDFEIAPTTPTDITVAPGSAAVWGFRLVNRGAWDQWLLSSSPAGLTFYADRTSVADATPDGLFDPATDQVVTQTPQIDPYDSFNFWVVADSTNDPGDYTWIGTAQSTAQPDATTGSSTWPMELSVEENAPPPSNSQVCLDANTADPAPVNSYTVVSYFLHNSGKTPWPAVGATDPVPGTNAANPLDLTTNDGVLDATWRLPSYSLDVDSSKPGRVIQPGGSTALPAQNAQWQMLRANTWYTGTIRLRLFVRNLDPGTPAQVQAQLFKATVSGASTSYATIQSSANTPVTTCEGGAGYREVVIDFPLTGVQKPGKTGYLGFRVLNTGTQSVSLAYDHDKFPSRITVVEK